jgi:antirestriction protein
MFLDYENYPDSLYSESIMSEDTFERIQEYAELDDDEREAYEAFMDVTCESAPSMEAFRERYCGEWDSEEAFAEHLTDELCMFDNVPESITRFFDFKAFARELFMSDYDMGDGGHVFRTC